jgi:glycosyltransferase involved in cell wall biosynthesis
MLSRFLENFSFGLSSSLAACLSPHPDVIYSNSWPVFASGLIALVAWARKIPLVLSIQDVYPESLLSQGRLSSDNLVISFMRLIDNRIAKSARAIIFISKRFADIYRKERGIPETHIHVVSNWSDFQIEIEETMGPVIRAKFGMPPDSFLLAYGGNIGVAAGVEGIIESLKYFDEEHRPHLLIAGEGPRLSACRAMAQELAPKHVHFYSPWPSQETGAVYNAADVMILPTSHEQSLASVPSKLINYMLSGRPIIAQGLPDSDLAEVIALAKCGWVVDPSNPALLAERVKEVIADRPEKRKRYGENGRSFALQHMTKPKCLPKVMHVIEQSASSMS